VFAPPSPPIQESRPPAVVGYAGQNQTGKSKKLRDHIAQWKAARHPDHRLVFDIGKREPGSFWVQGADRKPVRGKGGYTLLYPYLEKLTNYGNGPWLPPYVNPLVPLSGAFVRVEDAEGCIPPSITGTPWWNLICENAHCRVDVGLTFHRPQRVDKDILLACHWLYFFPMPENYAREYLENHPNLANTDILREGRWPEKRGQFIEIRQDPSRTHAATARFVDEYDPRLDPNMNPARRFA
jgi:hypothetical protein